VDITIRVGTHADATHLADLAARTFRDTFAEGTPADDMARHLSEAYGPVQQGRELSDSTIVTLLVEAGDQLVAYAQVRRGPAPACVAGDAPLELWRFYVDRQWHGLGIAQRLMQRVDEEAHRVGGRTLWLGVWEHNERAKAFYRKCGFVDVGAHVFMVGSDPQTDRILVRPIVPPALLGSTGLGCGLRGDTLRASTLRFCGDGILSSRAPRPSSTVGFRRGLSWPTNGLIGAHGWDGQSRAWAPGS